MVIWSACTYHDKQIDASSSWSKQSANTNKRDNHSNYSNRFNAVFNRNGRRIALPADYVLSVGKGSLSFAVDIIAEYLESV